MPLTSFKHIGSYAGTGLWNECGPAANACVWAYRYASAKYMHVNLLQMKVHVCGAYSSPGNSALDQSLQDLWVKGMNRRSLLDISCQILTQSLTAAGSCHHIVTRHDRCDIKTKHACLTGTGTNCHL